MFDFPPVDKEKGFDIVDEMRKVATDAKATVPQIALSWLLHQPGVSGVINGTRTLEQLEDNLGAVDVSLSDVQLQVLDDVSALKPEYPGWMIERQGADRRGQG